MNRQRRIDTFTREIENDLRDRTSKVLVVEDKEGRWDVRCYTEHSYRGRLSYIGGTSCMSDFDEAHKLAKFYAPCPEAITVEVGR